MDQEKLSKLLVQSIYENNHQEFENLLPQVTSPNLLGNAFQNSVSLNQLEMFNQLLPKITEHEYLNEALLASSYQSPEYFAILPNNLPDEEQLSNRKEMFNTLIHKVKDQSYLSEATSISIYLNNKAAFEAVLPMLKEESLHRPLLIATTHNNQEAFDALLPKIKDGKAIAKALNKAIAIDISSSKAEYDRRSIISKLSNIAKQESYVDDVIIELVNSDNKQAFNTLWPKVKNQAKVEQALGREVPDKVIRQFFGRPPIEAMQIATISTPKSLTNTADSAAISTHLNAQSSSTPAASTNIASQIALGAIAASVAYGAGKLAYNLYTNYVGANASQEEIDNTKEKIKKVKRVSIELAQYKTMLSIKHSGFVKDLNNLYDQGKQNSSEYASLRDKLDEFELPKKIAFELQDRLDNLKKESKNLAKPKLKQGYINDINKECESITKDYAHLKQFMIKNKYNAPLKYTDKIRADRDPGTNKVKRAYIKK